MTGTILVDDDDAILHMIEEALTSQGYECDTAQSVDIALEMIKAKDYNVIRRCQTLIDSENISAIYKTFKTNLFQMLENEYGLEIEQQNHIMTFMSEKMSYIFNTIKLLERIIVQERDSASATAGFAVELLEAMPESSPQRSLVSKIFEQASSER